MSREPKYKPGNIIKAQVAIGFLGNLVFGPDEKLVIVDVMRHSYGTYYSLLYNGMFIDETCAFVDAHTDLVC